MDINNLKVGMILTEGRTTPIFFNEEQDLFHQKRRNHVFPLLHTFPQSYFPFDVNCDTLLIKFLLKDNYQMLSFSDELSVTGEPDSREILVLYWLGLSVEGKCSIYYLKYLCLKTYLIFLNEK